MLRSARRPDRPVDHSEHPAGRARGDHLRRWAVALVVAAAAVPLAACGSDDDSDDSASTTTQPAAVTDRAVAAGKVTVDASEYAFAPEAITAKPGKLEIKLDNKGKIPHELVVLKTDEAPDSLKVSGGRVSEDASVGEVEEIDGGGSKSATVDVEAGKYVYVCNIPGHYGDGMRGQLTVK
jgi:uncharacterized cupredoxin-like copper-binding protein